MTGTFSPEITEADLRDEVEWLADPARDGRMTGTAGAQAPANWLADYFRQAGLQSFSDNFAMPFQFNAGERVLPDKTRLEIAPNSSRPLRAKLDQDFRPLPFSESGEASGEVVFAGYGLVAPGDHGARYDSYAGLDVKDKIVLILRYVPENVEPARRAQLNRYAGLRYKAMLARERGAKAVLVATGPNSPHAGELRSAHKRFHKFGQWHHRSFNQWKNGRRAPRFEWKNVESATDRARQRKPAREDHVRVAEA